MQARSKVVTLLEREFQLRKLPSDVGSFILMRMIGASMRMRSAEPPEKLTEEQEAKMKEATDKITGEDRVRSLIFILFSSSMDFADFKLIQNNCLRCVSLIEERDGQKLPIPIMNDDGVWTPGQNIDSDFSLISKLTSEVLVLCFSDFFDKSGSGMQT